MSYCILQKNQFRSNDLTIPLIDDAVIANIDNIIASFQHPNKVETAENLANSLIELKKVKELLHKINLESTSSSSISINTSSEEAENETIRNSIEMIKNGGKFVKSITEKNSLQSIKSISTSSLTTHKLSPKVSLSSLKNAITVSSCKPSRKPQKVARKNSPSPFSKKSEVSDQKAKKHKQKVNDEQIIPKIVKSFHSTCLIHQYDDNSHTFEIMNPKSVSCGGDTTDLKSEIVIVVMANLDTALFVSNHSSLRDGFYLNGNRVKS